MTDDSFTERKRLADAFDRETDPLAEYEATFKTTGVDPLELFVEDVLSAKDITPRTRADYHRLFDQWRAHMQTEGRHPACPAERHLRSFIQYERDEKENHPDTVQEKLRKLKEVYLYWQAAPSFPHSSEYNPFTIVKQTVSLDAPEQKPLPRIPLEELREFVGRIETLRNLAIVLVQLKLGLRATEVCNLPLGELDIRDEDVQSHYSSLGDHWMLDGRPNAVYIPHDRYFHPEYAETEHYRPVLSHYGRHRFTTFWRVEQDLPRPLVKYLRGDRPDSESITERDGIDEYIHTYYEDIESVYRREIYRFK